MRLSESKNAKNWLAQFQKSDLPFAKILLDSLTLVSFEEFLRKLQAFVQDEISTVEKPVALVPVRKMTPDQSYYYPVYERNAKPSLLFKNSFPGSEGLVANILRNIVKLGGKKDVVGVPSLANLRATKCRSVFFIDDMIGSGKRLKDFWPAFNRSKTIKSWNSYNYLKYYPITFSAMDSGLKAIRKLKQFEKVKYLIKCPNFDDQEWTMRQKKAIEYICNTYNERLYDSEFPLGFKSTAGMMVFEHGAPNNLPGILWKSGKNWSPLFPKRAVPEEMKIHFKSPNILSDINDRLKKIGQIKLSGGDWLNEADPQIKKIILVLSAISRRIRDLHKISDKTGLYTTEVKKIIIFCRELSLVDSHNLITEKGKNELEHARRLKIKLDYFVENESDDYYYPQMLRRAL